MLKRLGMGGTQNFVHGIYREKIPRYRVYRGTCFVVVVTRAKHTQQSNWIYTVSQKRPPFYFLNNSVKN